ncbi:MAG: hypothetical protein A3K76_07240, partial [Euryarchaeota archaeon RBG_13_57_23]
MRVQALAVLLSQLDEDVLHLLNHAGESPLADVVFVVFTLLGMFTVTLMAAPFLWAKDKRDSAFDLVLSVIIVSVLVGLVKLAVIRDRPFESLDGAVQTISFYGLAETSGSSFPSGHAARIFAVATIISLNVRFPAKVASLAIAVMVALSRVFLGLHWPTDVLAGALLGILVAFALARLGPVWRPYSTFRHRV